MCHVRVGDGLDPRSVAGNGRTRHVLEVLVLAPLGREDFAGHLVDRLSGGEGQGVINAGWRLWPIAHLVGDRAVNGIGQSGLVGAVRVDGASLVDRFARLAWVFCCHSNRVVDKVDGVSLIHLVIVVKDDFGALGVVAHQLVAQSLVGLDRVGGGVARLGIRYAGLAVGLQGRARLVIDVRNRSLLGVWGVDNFSIFTWISWNEAIWTYRYTIITNLWGISFIFRNNNLSGFSRVIRIRILGWYVPHEWITILINKESFP